ncbi:MAG: tetraacyldisaccharide 4'-kinase [Burkholderiales bacterium]
MSFVSRHWYRLSPVSVLLLPLSFLFHIAVTLRRLLYRLGILPSVRLPVPVIVVGNLTVGGTGKTPLVLWLAGDLRRRGRNPGILCRGYGGSAAAPREVKKGDDPGLVGDEPLLLAERAGCPVWVGADRAATGRALLAANPGCNVILCDDGLQHYRLARDFEIAVEDERGLGNGFLLPAGPLREPASRCVDARITNGGEASAGAWRMRLKPVSLYRVDEPAAVLEPSAFAGTRLHAVAGIGNPQRFFADLDAMGLKTVPHAFADHHRFQPRDLEFADCDFVLMTEKDAVKCRGFGRRDLIAVRADAELDPAFTDLIWSRIHGRAPA